jgi:hypothetical protein
MSDCRRSFIAAKSDDQARSGVEPASRLSCDWNAEPRSQQPELNGSAKEIATRPIGLIVDVPLGRAYARSLFVTGQGNQNPIDQPH